MMQLLRPKRQAHAADDLAAAGTAAGGATADVDPSAMTERQQLAFLLRATAPASDASAGGSSSSEHDDEEDADADARRRIPRSSRVSGSRNSPRSAATSQSANAAVPGGRGRALKTAAGDEPKKLLSPRSAKKQPTRKRLKVNTAPPRRAGRDGHDGGEDAAMEEEDAALDKTSPSSSSDVLRLSAFGDGGGDFWRAHCALCCDNAKLAAAVGVDALFLCPSCDQKYPTQRALGLV